MEEILDVKPVSTGIKASALSEDALAADAQADESENNASRTRYQRMFWEPTTETTVRIQALRSANDELIACRRRRRLYLISWIAFGNAPLNT